MKTLPSVLCAAVAIAIAQGAFAEGAASKTTSSKTSQGGSPNIKKAEAAFQRGIKAYKARDMARAVEEFRLADKLAPTWKIQYNIGQCEAALRRYGLAIEAFEQYLGKGGDEVPKPRQEEVLADLDRMRRMVGTIVVKGDPGVDIFVDGVKHGNTSVRSSIQVTAGVAHDISFVKGKQKLSTIKLTVSGGEVVELPVETGKAATVAVKPVPPAQRLSAPPPSKVSPQVPSTAPVYHNMRQLKAALQARKITKEEYRVHQLEIRRRRQQEYDALTAARRAGVITEGQYRQAIQACRRRYEGY